MIITLDLVLTTLVENCSIVEGSSDVEQRKQRSQNNR